MMNLKKLGFNDWFQDKVSPEKPDSFRIARVTSADKESYLVANGAFEAKAEITGKLMFTAESSLDYPTVGDWCYVQYFEKDSLAVIHEIFPRKSLLKRKKPGKKMEFQLIAANIDKAFIVQSLDSNYNLRRLERHLAMVNESGIAPFILLSKSDLLSPSQVEEKIAEIGKTNVEATVIAFSNIDSSGLETVKKSLRGGETFCLLGSSGVGKTTLLNSLLGKDRFETQAVREKDSKGKHTTTHRQLVPLENDAMIVDVPGIRELGNIGAEAGINQTFSEIAELAGQCRFSDCAHTEEKGCAVLEALEDGTISEERFQNFVKMNKESAFNEMSYLAKRRKDKNLRKLVKSVQKKNTKR